MSEKISPQGREETIVRGIACGGFGGEASAIDVKDGKIVRIRPFRLDTNYTMDELKDTIWELDRNGKTLKCPIKSSPPYQALAYKKRVYSKNRVLYPLKRVDWEPGGDPDKINPQNRGKSKFKRISWDEALDILESEIRRIQGKYGPFSVFCIGEDGHKESKMLHAGGGIHMAVLGELGGYTREVRTPDSNEGYYWGAKHVWGTGALMGLGLAAPAQNGTATWGVVQDITKHTDMLVFQAGDWETTQNYAGQFWSHLIRYWLDLGIKFVCVDPFCNYTAVAHDEVKWIPIRPNTDVAFDYGIMHVWLTENLYDVEYVNTHTVGFDKLKAYVLGEEDGIPKTPAWASEICGVPEWTIKALAREWGSKVTSTGHFCNGAIRGPYSHEAGRTEAYKLALQGIGKPGVQQAHLASMNVARQAFQIGGPTALTMDATRFRQFYPTAQSIPRTMVHHAIQQEEILWWGSPQIVFVDAADQFIERHYPIPEDQGGTRIHMVWSEKPCNQCCWNAGFKFQDAMRSPEVEFFVTNHQWIENDSLFGDLILPVCTCLENRDIVGSSQNVSNSFAAIQDVCVPPLGESKSDYQIGLALAERFGVADKLSLGMDEDEWFKFAFDNSPIKDEVSWETLKERKYYVPKLAPDWRDDMPGLRGFYEDPETWPLDTPSQKIEFFSEALEEHFPGDKERGGLARWVQGGPESEGWTHDETLLGERAKKYPLLFMASTGRWRVHVQCDDITWFREIETCKVRGKDGYLYEPMWINPVDAQARGIKSGDIVKVENERGIVLFGARVSNRVIPNCIMANKGSRVDPIAPHLDRGGSTNLISPDKPISSKCYGFVVSGYLVEASKVTDFEMNQWKADYPDAFARDYDPATGINFKTWVTE